MTPPTKQICKRIGQLLVLHPIAWLLPRIRWNAIEMMMAKNLLAGNGLIAAPLDPPALWRPLLGALVCAFVELFTSSPRLVYQIVYAVSLTTFLIASFYAARALWDAAAGHAAFLFILTSGALTSRLVSHVHSISHVVFLLAAGPALLVEGAGAAGADAPTPVRGHLVGLGIPGEMGSPARLRHRHRSIAMPYVCRESGFSPARERFFALLGRRSRPRHHLRALGEIALRHLGPIRDYDLLCVASLGNRQRR
jgi:hypothetical protein